MSNINATKNKNVVLLAMTSVVMSVLFSFLSAPLLRALYASVKARNFWLIGTALTAALFVAGSTNYQISETAVYVGATWMTLGIYSELEKRGVNWKSSGFFSICTGLLFALAGYFLILKNQTTDDIVGKLVEPMKQAINQAYPTLEPSELNFDNLILGFLAASLLSAIFFGLVFESRVTRLFNIRRERVVSGLRWLEFKLPDVAIWALLLSTFVYVQNWFHEPISNTISKNLALALVPAFFFQGIAVTEFMLRITRSGPFTRSILYLLIVLQLSPLIVLLGFVDYWADFRTLMRKKAKPIT
ncbi:MAG: DUF2232 domain-containing protein [Pseudobdellovibrio sp.]